MTITISPEGGPVPCPPGGKPLCYAKHIGDGQIIFRTPYESYHAAFIADGWHLVATLPAKP